MYKKQVFGSGLRVVVAPVNSMQSVAISVMVKNGSRYEQRQENGIAHFLEHMFFKGTKNAPTEFKLAEIFDKTGGNYNASTFKEKTAYYAQVRPKHFDIAMNWLSDIVLNPLLKEQDIKKEKGVILQERSMYLDTPTSYVWDLWEKLLYKDNPLGRLIIGEEKNIKSFKRKDFTNYLKKHFNSSNIVVCIAGNIEMENAFSKAEKYFSSIGKGLSSKTQKLEEKQKSPQILVHSKNTAQNHVCIGVRGVDLFNKKRYAQSVLANILGGMRSSRMFSSVRSEKGLAYYIHTHSQTYTDTGYLVTSAGLDKQKTEQGVELILKEYKKIKQKKVANKELEKAKENLKGSMSLSLEDSGSLASFIGNQELLKEEILTLEQMFERINEVGSDDILNLANEILVPETLNLAIIGDENKKNSLQKIINNF